MMTTVLLTLGGLLALTGAALLAWIVWLAFVDSAKQGLLCLLLPGYVLYYGWTRASQPHRRGLVLCALGAFAGAGIAVLVSTSFGADVTVAGHQPADDFGWQEDPSRQDGPGGQGEWEGFEDLEAPLNE